MTYDELAAKFPNASESFLRANSQAAVDADHHPHTGQVAKPERSARHAPLVQKQIQKADTARFLVSYCNARKRLLDADNLMSKYHTDMLRYCGFIEDDNPAQTKIVTSQRKVEKDEEEFIEITIDRL